MRWRQARPFRSGRLHRPTPRDAAEDDGKGLPRDFDLRLRPSDLDLRMVKMLADQVRARLTVDRRAGAHFTLTLPAPDSGRRANNLP